jgi:AraC-like DNA-binding protein
MSRVAVTTGSAWAAACSSAFVPLRVRSVAPSFSAVLQQRVLSPDVCLTTVSSGASEVFRSDRLIAQDPRDDLILSLHRSGGGSVMQHGREVRLRAGAAVLYDAASPYTLSFSGEMSEIVLQVPRKVLLNRHRDIVDVTARPLPQGSLLTALTGLAASVEPGVGLGRDDYAIADAMTTLLHALLNSDGTSSAPPLHSRQLLTSLYQYVDDHLADPALSPEHLAHAHHISLRLLQKLFADAGSSPATHIRHRRLMAGRRLLTNGMPVWRAAALTGFTNADSFARAFKRVLGISPSELSCAAQRSTPATALHRPTR